MRTNELHTNIVELSDIRKQKSNASSPYGPVKAGLTTSQTTLDQQLTELLSSLESAVASLVSKSSTVLDTLTTATKEMLAEPLPSTLDTDTTNV